MSATDGKLELRFHVPLKLGRGENNREVRGQRIGRIQREREALFFAWPRAVGLPPHRGFDAQDGRMVLLPVRVPCTVTFTRVAPGQGLDPEENLPGSCKAVKDEVAAILGVDDRDPRVTWKYAQQRGPWGLWVEVTATLPGPEVVAPKASRSAPPKKHARPLKKPKDLMDALLNHDVALRREARGERANVNKAARDLLAMAKPAFIPPARRST